MMYKRSHRLTILLIVAICASICAIVLIVRPEPVLQSPDVAKIIANAADVTTKRYPESDTVLISSITAESCTTNGLSTWTCTEYTKVLTPRAVSYTHLTLPTNREV